MSRAAEAFKMRKNVRQAQQLGQAAARSGTVSSALLGGEDANDDHLSQQVAAKNLVPMKVDGNFNMTAMLARKIQASEYFKSLRELTTVPQLADEIKHNVRSLDPWMKTPNGDAATAFCALYRLCELRPTRKQLTSMLSQKDAPFVRALGFLFLRFAAPADQLLEWFEPYFFDMEQFRPLEESSKPWTLGAWIESLLEESKFGGVILPRFPYKIEQSLRSRIDLLREERKRFDRNFTRKERFVAGTKVEALYSEDGKWYAAEVVGPAEGEGYIIVHFTAYEDQGVVSLGAVRLLDDPVYSAPVKMSAGAPATFAGRPVAPRDGRDAGGVSSRRDSSPYRRRRSPSPRRRSRSPRRDYRRWSRDRSRSRSPRRGSDRRMDDDQRRDSRSSSRRQRAFSLDSDDEEVERRLRQRLSRTRNRSNSRDRRR
mmetsp:Transcript_20907/g.33720  ORF Transcript_20907/g.33720 Transcript_20907/m.33720 type:complete len:427 (-) Transcript_20907:241-1521(-)